MITATEQQFSRTGFERSSLIRHFVLEPPYVWPRLWRNQPKYDHAHVTEKSIIQ